MGFLSNKGLSGAACPVQERVGGREYGAAWGTPDRRLNECLPVYIDTKGRLVSGRGAWQPSCVNRFEHGFSLTSIMQLTPSDKVSNIAITHFGEAL